MTENRFLDCPVLQIWNREPHLGPPNSPDFALSDDHLLASFRPYMEEKNSKTVAIPNFECVATSGHGAATFHSRALIIFMEGVEGSTILILH